MRPTTFLVMLSTIALIDGARIRPIIRSQDQFQFSVSFQVPSLYQVYIAELANKSTDIYKEAAQSHLSAISDQFVNTDGFRRVYITSFMNASDGGYSICSFDMVFTGRVNLTDFKQNLASDFLYYDVFTGIFVWLNSSVMGASSSLEDAMSLVENRQQCLLYKDPCDLEYTCSVQPALRTVTCTHKCEGIDCENNGQCFFDRLSQTAKCSCTDLEDEFSNVYYGPTCSYKTEKFKMKKNYIILITAAGGGLVVIGLVAAVVAMYTVCAPPPKKNRYPPAANKVNTSPY